MMLGASSCSSIKLSAWRRDTDQQRARFPGESFREGRDDGNRPAEAQNILRRLPCPRRIDHGDDVLGRVTDAGIRRLRPKRAECAFGEDEKT